MRRRTRALVALSVIATVFSMTAALPSPPVGQFTWHDEARGTAVESGMIQPEEGKGVFVGNYTLGAGSSSGWRSTGGEISFVVGAGSMTLIQPEPGGCQVRELQTGDAVVAARGVYDVANRGTEPLALTATFVNLPPGDTTPMVDDGLAAAPPGCLAAATASGSGAVLTKELGRGLTVPAGVGTHHKDASRGVPQDKGKDTFSTSYHLSPGTSTGWHHHPGDAIGIVTRGTMTVYEANGGQCDVTVYKTGDAFYINDHHTQHLARNEDASEPLEIRGTYYNVPHGEPLPFFENELDARQEYAPPAGCPMPF
jgi:quercetin dioxygenase-like cupin family protein